MSTPAAPRARLIVKGPAAGDAALRAAVEAARGDGARLDVRVTYEGGDAERFAREAADDGVERVIAAGGDGTVNEVLRGLLDAQAPVCAGLVPMGTANDFARTAGAPLDAPARALHLALTAPPRAIDVGRVNGAPFLNVSSCGLGAEIVAETPLGLKRLLGGAAYSVAALRRMFDPRPTPLRIDAPDFAFEGDALIVAVGNARTAGGGYRVAGRALLDDGLLDVLVVHDIDVQKLATLFASLTEVGPDGAYEGCTYVQVPRLRIDAPNGLHVNVDGEPMHGTSFDYALEPRALRFALGDGAPLADA